MNPNYTSVYSIDDEVFATFTNIVDATFVPPKVSDESSEDEPFSDADDENVNDDLLSSRFWNVDSIKLENVMRGDH